jgi:hypothetical protein
MNPSRSSPPAAERRSALAKAIEEMPRRLHEFEVEGFFGLGNKAIERIKVRVPVKIEEDGAIVDAHKYVVQAAQDLDDAKRDADLLADSKIIEILFRACCDADDPKYSAFPGPKWMRQHLGTAKLAALMHLVAEAARREHPRPQELDDERLEAIATACAKTATSDVPEALLAGYDRTWLTHAFVLLACKWQDDRERRPVLEAEVETLRALVSNMPPAPAASGEPATTPTAPAPPLSDDIADDDEKL